MKSNLKCHVLFSSSFLLVDACHGFTIHPKDTTKLMIEVYKLLIGHAAL